MIFVADSVLNENCNISTFYLSMSINIVLFTIVADTNVKRLPSLQKPSEVSGPSGSKIR